MESNQQVDINEIMRALPHRYPFLLIDRILEFETEKRILVLKNVTINEPFFTGHFPDAPIMPGVLILEAMAQAAGMLAIKTEITRRREPGHKLYFTGIDDTRFRRPVVPGDALHLDITLLKRRRDLWRFSGRALVEGKVAAESQLTCAMIGA